MNKKIVNFAKKIKTDNSFLWKILCSINNRITSRISGNVIVEYSFIKNSTLQAGARSNMIKITGGGIEKLSNHNKWNE